MTEEQPKIVIGIDGGATKTNVVAVDIKTKEPIAHWKGPCTNINSVGPAAVKAALTEGIAYVTKEAHSDGAHVLGIALGLSGIDRPENQEEVKRWIHEIVPQAGDLKIGAYNDAIAALASGTLGHLENSIVLISGTGVIAWGYDDKKNQKRAAGWGPLMGDEGCGYQIGYDVLRHSAFSADGRGPATELLPALLQHLKLSQADDLIPWCYSSDRVEWARFADLAPLAAICAKKGDKVAQSIVDNAVHQLFITLSAVIRDLGLDKAETFTVVLSGGNLTHEGSIYAQGIIAKIEEVYRNRAKVVFPKINPEKALALLLMLEQKIQ